MLSKHPQIITDRHGRHWATVKGRRARYEPMMWWTVPAGSKANPKSCGTTIRERDRILNDLHDFYIKRWANQLEETTMDLFTATMIAEGAEEAESEEQYLEAWQLLIDTGTCWTLQGFFGRTAIALIEAGHCRPAQ